MSHFRGNTGTLIIVVSRGKDLPNKRKMEKQNPYCLLRISNLTDRTKADIRGGQTPKWDEEFRFSLSAEIQPILKLSVLDETKKAPVLVAETEIDFTPVFYSSVEEGYDKWFPLTSNKREAGMIYLEMTFYPATINATQSPKKSFTSQSPTRKKRILPPIPGHVLEDDYDEVDQASGIPAPLPRNLQPLLQTNQENSNSAFYHSDSFRPQLRQDFSKSTMSIHSLPDVPSHNSISKNLPTIKHQVHHELANNHPEQSTTKVHHDIKHEIPIPSSKHVIPPSHPTRQLPKSYEISTNLRKLTDELSYGDRTQSISTSNDFDELERQVQSDWERNNQKPAKNAPPLPSHSTLSLSGNSNSSSKSLPPPLPHHSTSSLTRSSIYDVIEPPRASGSGSRSPTRKPPTDHYGSTSDKLESFNLPFDANSIGSKPQTDQKFNIHDQNVLTTKGRYRTGDDELAEGHHAPTPYEAFVGKTPFDDSSLKKSSPTRFQSSLPPLPPRH